VGATPIRKRSGASERDFLLGAVSRADVLRWPRHDDFDLLTLFDLVSTLCTALRGTIRPNAIAPCS
jgi:hypothetical protein